MTADPQRQDSHAKGVGKMVGRFSEAEEVVKTDPEIFRIPGKMADHHLARESVVSGRHRSVSRKNVRRSDNLERRVIFQPFILRILADPLQGEKRGVALVHVINLRVDTEHIQGPDSTDPQDDLLPYSHFQVTAIQLCRDWAIFRGILLDIRIEQVKLDPADLQLPDLGRYVSTQN